MVRTAVHTTYTYTRGVSEQTILSQAGLNCIPARGCSAVGYSEQLLTEFPITEFPIRNYPGEKSRMIFPRILKFGKCAKSKSEFCLHALDLETMSPYESLSDRSSVILRQRSLVNSSVELFFKY